MNYAQLYSLTSGQKIDKFHTFEKYYPLPFDNYIVIQPFSKPAKNYDYIDEVISLIHPILEKNNIKIIQVGGKDERQLNFCYPTQGTTSFGQLEYLISKAKLVLTVDSISAHLAGHYNIPLVDIVSNNYSQCVSPYFGDKSKQIILEPDRTNKLPSFSLDEGPNKQVNEILSETIASSVCKLLNISFSYPFQTLSMGKLYHNKIIETCLDSVINLQSLNIPSIVCRLDYSENPNLAILIEQMKVGKVSILTNKPLPINLLQQFRPQIQEVIIEITESHNPLFCKELQDAKIPFRMYSRLSDEKLNPIKLDYLDFQPIITKISEELPDKVKNCNKDNLYIKGGKFLLSKNGIYNSYWAFKNNKPVPNFNSDPVKFEGDIEDLKRDCDYNLFLTKE